MDNVTHTLTGLAISQTGLNRQTRFATLTLILAANAPDIDVLWGFRGGISYLQHHRGISHSLLGVVILALIIAAAVYEVGKRMPSKPGAPIRFGWLLLAAGLGTGSHLLLDFTNGYGVRPFLPFSGRWYAWDIMPIIDPMLLGILIVGLGLPWLLRLVSEEVGARKPRWSLGAVLCLAVILALWMVRDFAHRRAVTILDSRTYAGENPRRVGAFPVPIDPFAWSGVAETEDAFHVLHVDALQPNNAPEVLEAFTKPPMSPALAAAMRTRGAGVFLDFARFPWAEVNKNEGGFQVSLSDLRFFDGASRRRGFTLDIELSRSLQTESEQFRFAPPRRD